MRPPLRPASRTLMFPSSRPAPASGSLPRRSAIGYLSSRWFVAESVGTSKLHTRHLSLLRKRSLARHAESRGALGAARGARSRAGAVRECRPMHPFLRNVVISVVGLIIAGGLSALALLGRDSSLSVIAMLSSALLAAAVGIFLFAQGWVWSSRAAQQGYAGRSVAIALAGGLMILLAAGALAGAVILVVLFYL